MELWLVETYDATDDARQALLVQRSSMAEAVAVFVTEYPHLEAKTLTVRAVGRCICPGSVWAVTSGYVARLVA